MKDKKFSLFFKRYLTVLLIILVLGLIAVWAILSFFQKNHDSDEGEEAWVLSQNAFENYVSEMTPEDWALIWEKQHPDCLDTHETVLSVMSEMFSDNVYYAKDRDYTDESPDYYIVGVFNNGNDGQESAKTLAKVSLIRVSETEWQISDTEMLLEGDIEASVAAPSGCTVLFNGKELDASYISSVEDRFFLEEYEANLVNAVKLETWTATGLFTEPEISVVPPDGTDLFESDDGETVLVQSHADEALCKKADEFFDAYNKYGLYGYYDKEINMRTAASHCKEGSQAYNLIYDSLEAIKLAPCHSVYTTNKDMGPVIVWADNAVSIDITYDTETTYGANEKDYFSGTYRILMIDFGDGYEICGFVNR